MNDDITQLKIDKSGGKGPSRRRGMTFFLFLSAALAGILLLLYMQGTLRPAAAVEVVTVARVYPSQTESLLNASGYVVAQRKAAVATKVTGKIIAISVEEGNRVKKGDIIARLEQEDVSASRDQARSQVEAAQAGLERARAELQDAGTLFERQRELIAKGFVSKTEYDAAEARHAKAKASAAEAEAAVRTAAAALRGAEVSLEYTLIRAPFDAVVLTKSADVGDIVTPLGAAANAKAAVVTIADMNSLQVEVDVSESNLGIVKPGQPCEIYLDAYPDLRLRGEVHMIVPTADRAKASVLVKVRFLDRDSRVLPEMSAKVAFLGRALTQEDLRPRTAVNASSVVSRGAGKAVFVVKDGRAVETPVTTAETMGDMISIVSGLNPGDRIIARPSQKIRDGMSVKTAVP